MRFTSPEDTRICDNGKRIMHGNPDTAMPTEACEWETSSEIDLTNCISYFDGCNNCSVENGRPNACTLMYCETPTEPKCNQYSTETWEVVNNSENTSSGERKQQEAIVAASTFTGTRYSSSLWYSLKLPGECMYGNSPLNNLDVGGTHVINCFFPQQYHYQDVTNRMIHTYPCDKEGDQVVIWGKIFRMTSIIGTVTKKHCYKTMIHDTPIYFTFLDNHQHEKDILSSLIINYDL